MRSHSVFDCRNTCEEQEEVLIFTENAIWIHFGKELTAFKASASVGEISF